MGLARSFPNASWACVSPPCAWPPVFTDLAGSSGGASNSNGFLSSSTLAYGLPEQQIFTYQLDQTSRRRQSVTDPLGRQTAYIYDSLGNLTSITRLSGTPQAVTTTFTFDPTFNQLTGAPIHWVIRIP